MGLIATQKAGNRLRCCVGPLNPAPAILLAIALLRRDWGGTSKLISKGHECRQILFQNILVGVKADSLDDIATEREIQGFGCAHLQRRGDHKYRVRAHLEAILPRRQPALHHEVELGPQLLGGVGNMFEPLNQIIGRVKAAQIEVAGPVAKPAPHLHQGVVHLGCAQEVAGAEPFEGQPPGKLVASNSNYF
ncbi:hypothetical protein D9M70_549260 [compost metagenome]